MRYCKAREYRLPCRRSMTELSMHKGQGILHSHHSGGIAIEFVTFQSYEVPLGVPR